MKERTGMQLSYCLVFTDIDYLVGCLQLDYTLQMHQPKGVCLV